jgi:hypothetical protein
MYSKNPYLMNLWENGFLALTEIFTTIVGGRGGYAKLSTNLLIRHNEYT